MLFNPQMSGRRRALQSLVALARKNRRDTALLVSAVANIAGKAISVLTLLVSVPMTLHYLGAERYGIWLTVTSFSMFFSFADLGLGSGMLTLLAARSGLGEIDGMRRIVASGYAALALVAAVLLTGLALVYAHLDYAAFFGLRSADAKAEAGPTVAVFLTCFSLGIPITAIQKIQSGLQQGYAAAAWQAAASILSVILLYVGIRAGVSLAVLLALFSGSPILISAINTLSFFAGRGRALMPRWRYVAVAEVYMILRTGLFYFGAQLAIAMGFGFDALILAHRFGSASVQQLAVPERIFALIGLACALALSPLWPAYGEARAKGDHAWIVRTYRRSLVFVATLTIVSSAALVVLGRPLMHLWVGDAVSPSIALLAGLAFWRIADAWSNAVTTLLNGLGALSSQLLAYILLAAVMIPLKLYLVAVFGISGIPWAAGLAYLVVIVAPLTLVANREINRLGRT